ncbi:MULTISPECIES: DJ-1/PfpI family protein [unclassified Duganella]|uniref:DJ-1/PfpI family protein n=1 Tax=unclassified Duganella TaxID=2636909 RepID=UPI00088D7AE3|nr:MULTISPECIES: DJ-1/PfpI family protein [unclassified Duganella]SDH23242.1 DJ-1/PfpI family protein [Duganella sp. OV458]SDK45280.1 DJ-1/PfpI family protein [Duganella sp. OV510]
MTRIVGIYVFDNVEVLDFAGPYEVFTCASRVAGGVAPFAVRTIAATRAPVRARAGLEVHPEASFADIGPVDVLIVPGGVVTAELARPEVMDWMANMARECELVASVCTGALLLAEAGLLDGLEATTHWEDLEALRAGWPQVQVRPDRRWIDNGRIVTSAGISAGIDMSLHLVARLASRPLAERTARQMDYDWRN